MWRVAIRNRAFCHQQEEAKAAWQRLTAADALAICFLHHAAGHCATTISSHSQAFWCSKKYMKQSTKRLRGRARPLCPKQINGTKRLGSTTEGGRNDWGVNMSQHVPEWATEQRFNSMEILRIFNAAHAEDKGVKKKATPPLVHPTRATHPSSLLTGPMTGCYTCGAGACGKVSAARPRHSNRRLDSEGSEATGPFGTGAGLMCSQLKWKETRPSATLRNKLVLCFFKNSPTHITHSHSKMKVKSQ